MANQDSDRDLVVTFEQTRDDLEEVERKIGVALNIRGTRGHIRRELLRLDREGALVETKLVAEWYDLFASYLDWTRNESWHGPPKGALPQENEQGAAASGPSAFVDHMLVWAASGYSCPSIPNRSGISMGSSRD
jgi:hypothetical protein